MLDANVGSTHRVLDAVASAGIDRLVVHLHGRRLRRHPRPDRRRALSPRPRRGLPELLRRDQVPGPSCRRGADRRQGTRSSSPCPASSTVRATTLARATSSGRPGTAHCVTSPSPTPASRRPSSRTSRPGSSRPSIAGASASRTCSPARTCAWSMRCGSRPVWASIRSPGSRCRPALRPAAGPRTRPARPRRRAPRGPGRGRARGTRGHVLGVLGQGRDGARVRAARPRERPAVDLRRRLRAPAGDVRRWLSGRRTTLRPWPASSRSSNRRRPAGPPGRPPMPARTCRSRSVVASPACRPPTARRPATPPRLDPRPDAVRRQLPRPQGPAPRPGAQHGLRGGPLPQHRGVLGPAHRHDHDPRRHLHPGLRVLRGQDRPAHLVRRRRAAPRRRGGRGLWTSSTWSSRASPATTCPTAAPASSPRPSARCASARPGMGIEVLIPDFDGIRRPAADRHGRPAATSSTTTSRP